jgi:hypothetical protein
MVQDRIRSSSSQGEASPYEIQIHGELDERWSDWFDGIKITIEHTGDRLPLTTLICPAMDQAKLRGMLNKIWDLNLNIISVRQVHDPMIEEVSSGGFEDIQSLCPPDRMEGNDVTSTYTPAE